MSHCLQPRHQQAVAFNGNRPAECDEHHGPVPQSSRLQAGLTSLVLFLFRGNLSSLDDFVDESQRGGVLHQSANLCTIQPSRNVGIDLELDGYVRPSDGRQLCLTSALTGQN